MQLGKSYEWQAEYFDVHMSARSVSDNPEDAKLEVSNCTT
jgi:hypothetical protein